MSQLQASGSNSQSVNKGSSPIGDSSGFDNSGAMQAGDDSKVNDNGGSHSRALLLIYLCLFLVAFLIKFKDFTRPPYDKHNFRQTQTLVTIEDYYKNGIDLLRPKTHYVGNPGYHVLEFPLFQGAMALLWKCTLPSIGVVRLANMFFGLLSAFLIYKMLCWYSTRRVAVTAALLFVLSPLNLIYHRSMLIDPLAVLFMLLTLYFYLPSEHSSSPLTLLRWMAFTLSITGAALVKCLYLFPFVIIFMLTFRKKPVAAQVRYWFSNIFAFILLVLWMRHASFVNHQWYFTSYLSISHHIGFSAFFTPSFWAAMIFRCTGRFMPGTGFFLLVLSLCFIACSYLRKDSSLSKDPLSSDDTASGETPGSDRLSECDDLLKRSCCIDKVSPLSLIKLCWAIVILYLLFFAAMNRVHDYYQMVLIPFLTVPAALALDRLVSLIEDKGRASLVAGILIISMAVPSFISFMRYSEPVSTILTFRDRVSPLVAGDNRFVFLFYKPSKYGGVFELFPKVASLYSIHKWGKCFSVGSSNDVVSVLEKLPEDVRKSAGELILYKVPLLTDEQVKRLAELGFARGKCNRYAEVFTLIDGPPAAPEPR